MLSQDSRSEDADLDATGGQRSEDEELVDLLECDQTHTLATYKNLYWTRVISVSHFNE